MAATNVASSAVATQVENGHYGRGIGSGPGGSISIAAGTPGSWINSMDNDQLRGLFFGPPNRPEKTSSYQDEFSVNTRTAGWAAQWEGENIRIKTVIQRMVKESDQWMLQIFPVTPMPGGSKEIHFQRLIFDDAQLDRVPEFGTVKLTSNRWESWSVSTDRRGLGFTMVDSFLMTPIGIETYMRSCLTISNAIQDALQLGCYWQLLHVHNQPGADLPYVVGATFAKTIEDVIEHECRLWAILQKSPDGLTNMMKFGRTTLQHRGVRDPNVVILPNNSLSALKASLSNSGVLHSSVTGKAGVDAYLNGLSNQLPFNLPGLQIKESTLFPIGIRGELIDPVVAHRVIGEFFRAEHVFSCSGVPADKYTTMLRAINVYDEDVDAMVTIPIAVGLANSGLFDQKGEPDTAHGKRLFSGTGGLLINHIRSVSKIARLDIEKYLYDVFAAKKETDRNAILRKMEQLLGAARGRRDQAAAPGGAELGAAAIPPPGGVEGAVNRDAGAKHSRFSSKAGYNTVSVSRSYPGDNVAPEVKNLSGATPAAVVAFLSASDAKRSELLATGFEAFYNALKAERDKARGEAIPMGTWVDILRYIYRTQKANQALLRRFKIKFETENEQVRDFYQTLYDGVPFTMDYHTAGLHQYVVEEYSSTNAKEVEAFTVKAKLYPEFNKRFPNAFVSSMLSASTAPDVKTREDFRGAVVRFCMAVEAHLKNAQKRSDEQTELQKNILDWFESSAVPLYDAVSEAGGGETPAAAVSTISSVFERKLSAAEVTAAGALAARIRAGAADQTSYIKPMGGAVAETDFSRILARLKNTRAVFMALIDHDLPLPLDFLYARAMMRYATGTGIMLDSRGVGASYLGGTQFEIGNDVATSVLHGKYTGGMASVIFNPEAVVVLPNVQMVKYLGGGGTTFFNSQNRECVNRFRKGHYDRRSLMCVPRYLGDGFTARYADMTGYFPANSKVKSAGYGFSETAKSSGLKAPHLDFLPEVANTWGFTTLADYFETGVGSSTVESFRLNTTICQGFQSSPRYDGQNLDMGGNIIGGAGHWGNKVYNGCAAHRMGHDGGLLNDAEIMKKQRPSGVVSSSA